MRGGVKDVKYNCSLSLWVSFRDFFRMFCFASDLVVVLGSYKICDLAPVLTVELQALKELFVFIICPYCPFFSLSDMIFFWVRELIWKVLHTRLNLIASAGRHSYLYLIKIFPSMILDCCFQLLHLFFCPMRAASVGIGFGFNIFLAPSLFKAAKLLRSFISYVWLGTWRVKTLLLTRFTFESFTQQWNNGGWRFNMQCAGFRVFLSLLGCL